MRFNPSRRWEDFAYAMMLLGVSGLVLFFIASSTLAYVTADAQPATIIDTGYVHRSNRHSEAGGTSLTFKLRDGSVEAEQVHHGLFWWPSVGETIHVYEAAPGDWKVKEDFSWPATIGWTLICLVIAIATVWDWVVKTLFPKRWAESQRRERERRRAASKANRRLSRRPRAKAQQPPSA